MVTKPIQTRRSFFQKLKDFFQPGVTSEELVGRSVRSHGKQKPLSPAELLQEMNKKDWKDQ